MNTRSQKLLKNTEGDEWAATLSVLAAKQKEDPLVWSLLRRRLKDGSCYSIMQPPYHFPFLAEIYQVFGRMNPRERIAIQKAAQLGITELAINATFWFMSQKKENALYMLPSQTQESDFAQERLDVGAIFPSPYIRSAFSDIANVRLKIGWNQALYLRGSQSTGGLISIPVGLLIRDEYDRMDPEGRDLAETRLGASRWKWKFDLSNPSVSETGINHLYLGGTQHEWFLKCENGHYRLPEWPESIKDGQIVCAECGSPVDRGTGIWVAKNPSASYRSFHLSQLASPLVDPAEIEEGWKEADGNLTKMQQFYNFVLGLPFTVQTIDMTSEMLQRAMGFHPMQNKGKHTFMGIDPGGVNWFIVVNEERKIVSIGTASWEELERMMFDYGVEVCAIELEPETRASKAFAAKFPDRVLLVDYRGAQTEPETKYKMIENDTLQLVQPNRTEIIDEALSSIRTPDARIIPRNAPDAFFKHMKNIQRGRKVIQGREVYVYTNKGPDHYCHALAFATLAWQHRQTVASGPIPVPAGVSKSSTWKTQYA